MSQHADGLPSACFSIILPLDSWPAYNLTVSWLLFPNSNLTLPPRRHIEDHHLPSSRTTIVGTIAGGPQTYCTCGSIMAGINTEAWGSLVYKVYAGDPPSTVATRTIADPPATTEAPPAETSTIAPGTCSRRGLLSTSACHEACGHWGLQSWEYCAGPAVLLL